MDTIVDRILGKVVFYVDFVLKSTSKDGEVTYRQSNTRLNHYVKRLVALCIYNGKIMVSSVGMTQGDTPELRKKYKDIARSKLHTILKQKFDILPDNSGITYVPKEYLDYLWQDKHTYNILYGLVDPTYARACLAALE